MPDFALQALDGRTWTLSGHRGEVILVNFWATWCPPCRAEMPGLARVNEQLRHEGFTVAGIGMDDEGERVIRPFVAQHPIPYPVLLPPGNFPLESAIQSLPTSFLVDREGRIAKVYVGEIDQSVLLRDAKTVLAERD